MGDLLRRDFLLGDGQLGVTLSHEDELLLVTLVASLDSVDSVNEAALPFSIVFFDCFTLYVAISTTTKTAEATRRTFKGAGSDSRLCMIILCRKG